MGRMGATISRTRFAAWAAVFLLVHAVAAGMFLRSRPPLGPKSWEFLEQQRPRFDASGASFTIVSDGLNFALARRMIGGGWEEPSVKLFVLGNLPAYLAAHVTFDALQGLRGGTSRRHSDIATAVFAGVAAMQWLGIALLLSRRRGQNTG